MSANLYNALEFGITREDIDLDVLRTVASLQGQGYTCYIVGGAIRDLLLGRKPKDYDLATNATPKELKNMFRAARIIGRRFKLVHLYFTKEKYVEIATFRREQSDEDLLENSEGELKYDHNQFGTEETDAFRRDLTINALFLDPIKMNVIDYVSGVEDLRSGTIRVIGKPEKRFEEDPVRMLRTIRHSVRTGFSIATDVTTAISQQKQLLKKAPTSRIYEEFKKDLLSGYCSHTLRKMNEQQLLNDLAPNLATATWLQANYSGSFVNIWRRAEEIIWESEEPPSHIVTAVLCLLVLSFKFAKRKTFLTTLQGIDRSLTTEIIKDCFAGLTVPRSEMANISDVIELLKLCVDHKSHSFNPKKIARHPSFNVLLLLLEFLNVSNYTTAIIKRLNDFQKTSKNTDHRLQARN